MEEKNKKKETLYTILGFLYMPVYLVGWIIHKVARLVLALAYLLMLRPVNAMSIIVNLFNIANEEYVRGIIRK